ncbi:MAG: orotate phosphoribosyltransferase [Deltaproteobacteria bacterium]|nr:orotate phosphoribosyltransferase [Deltaproteobacteria bacterium]
MNKEDIAKILTKNRAVTVNTKDFYIYTSGIKSPIYCDNRLLLAAVEDRKKIIEAFIKILADIKFDIAAGVSTAGIPWASWIGMATDKPVSYIRAGKKEHGKKKSIEGADVLNKNIVVIEDLITTGKSSLAAVKEVENAGGYPKALVSIFNYGFKTAEDNFKNANFLVLSLSDFKTLLSVSECDGDVTQKDTDILRRWHDNPEAFQL